MGTCLDIARGVDYPGIYKTLPTQAAAIALKELQKISDIKVDVSKLLEKGEEIRLKARDIMKRTQEEMSRMKKAQEYDHQLKD